MTPSEFAVAITTLFEGLGKPLPPPRTLDVWSSLLLHLDAEQLRRAVAEFLRSGDDWPNAGKLLRLADRSPTADDRAAIALQAVRRAVERWGHWRSVVFDDVLTTVAVRDLGGWDRLCQEDLSCPHFARRWTAAYSMRMRNGFPPESAAPLVGECGRSNRLLGHTEADAAVEAVGLPPVPGLPTLADARRAARLGPATIPRLNDVLKSVPQ